MEGTGEILVLVARPPGFLRGKVFDVVQAFAEIGDENLRLGGDRFRSAPGTVSLG